MHTASPLSLHSNSATRSPLFPWMERRLVLSLVFSVGNVVRVTARGYTEKRYSVAKGESRVGVPIRDGLNQWKLLWRGCGLCPSATLL